MKYLYTILIFSVATFFVSCEKESDLVLEMSEADITATEGMEEAYHEAKEYNDSLIWCADTGTTCSVATVNYYDSLFHHFDDEFEMHHANYSHNNVEDDHHHSATSMHSHGNPNVGHDEEEEEEGHNEGHSIESHYEMEELRLEHKEYHPL